MLTPFFVALALAVYPPQQGSASGGPSGNKVDLPMPPPPPGAVKKPPATPATTPPATAPKSAPAAAVQPAVSPIKLAALELSGLNMDAKETGFYSEHVAQQLAFMGLRVTTSKEINTLIGFERQKHLLSCNEGSSSCVAELANALGVDCILTGDIGKFGTKYQITLKVLSAQDARVLSAHSARVNGDEALLDELTRAARRMAPEIARKMGRTLVKTAHADDPIDRPVQIPWGWIALGTGAALGGGGGYMMSLAANRYEALRTAQSQIQLDAAQKLRNEGVTFQTLGYVGIGVGAAAVAGGVTLLVLKPGQGGKAAVLPTNDGFVFSYSGVFQ